MSELIPLSVPTIQGNEWKYIKEYLDTGSVSSAGKYILNRRYTNLLMLNIL